jgi:hypothetical protein
MVRASIGVYLVVLLVVAGPVFAETLVDCTNTRIEQRRAGRAELDREGQACQGDRQCVAQAQAKWHATEQQIDSASSACRARVQSQAPRPPAIHWKPGDPPPVAPDGRRYIMSCSGKVLGLYKPGGAVEMELKTHPGNCFPNDNPWPGPGVGAPGTAATNHCYEQGTGLWKDYSGSRPNWCDPTR